MIELTVPKEIDSLAAEAAAMKQMRDIYVKLPFGYRRATKAAKEAEILVRSFWQKLYVLYPEVKDGKWTYFAHEMVVRKHEEVALE